MHDAPFPATYAALVAELFPRLTGGIRWGLGRTRRMLAGVGDPHLRYPVLHIGGTNGKGSVAAHAEAVLRMDGRRTGLYTSPHLCTFRERILIGGEAIEPAALLAAAERLWPAIVAEQPSFFEATTAIALLALAEAHVDIGVIEVGLGGRLDATNVLDPVVTVLTNVALDHVQLLGPTLEDVAREKAGIIKPGVPVITAETGTTAAAVFGTAAAAVGAPLATLTPDQVSVVACTLEGTWFHLGATAWGELSLKTALLGAHQALNAALAVQALGALPASLRPDVDAVHTGLAAVQWPGRLQHERIGAVDWYLDVAHNVAGVQALVAALDALPVRRPLTVVVGVLGDKDWHNMLEPLAALAGTIVLTAPPTAPPERRWDPHEVLRAVPLEGAIVEPDFSVALERAQRHALRVRGDVVVTGSVHTVGDTLAAFGRCRYGSDVEVAPPALPA